MQKEAKRVIITFANSMLQSGCGHSCSSCPNSAQCHGRQAVQFEDKNEIDQQNVDIASPINQQQEQQIQKSNKHQIKDFNYKMQNIDNKQNKNVNIKFNNHITNLTNYAIMLFQ